MNKRLVFLSAVLLLVLILCGCSKDNANKPEGPAPNVITFEEQTVIDNADYTVKFTNYDIDPMWGPKFTVTYTNRSSTDLIFAFKYDLVNGNVALSDYFSQKVEAGSTDTYELTWLESTLQLNGISYIESYKATLELSDANDWFAEPVLELPFEIMVGNSSEEPATVLPEFEYDSKVLCNTSDIRATIVDVTTDENFGYPLAIIKLENKSDINLAFSVSGCKINGVEIDSWWGPTIPAHGCSYSRLTFDSDTLNSRGIDQIERCELTLRSRDAEDIFAEPVYENIVQF